MANMKIFFSANLVTFWPLKSGKKQFFKEKAFTPGPHDLNNGFKGFYGEKKLI